MPLEGLPSTLEAMLTALLQENAVQSFKIDYNNSKTVVVLRFTPETGQQHGATTTQSSVSFKKKNPSQIARDRERAEAFQQQQRHQQQQQQHQSVHQASELEIQEHSLSTTCLLTSDGIPLGLRNSEVVNKPRHSPTASRGNREVHRAPQQAFARVEDTHVQCATTNTQQSCESKQRARVVSDSCSGGGDGNNDDRDIDEQAAASLKDSMSQLLEECSRLSQQHQQMNQQQRRQHQEIISMQATGRPPPPSRYHLRSGPRM